MALYVDSKSDVPNLAENAVSKFEKPLLFDSDKALRALENTGRWDMALESYQKMLDDPDLHVSVLEKIAGRALQAGDIDLQTRVLEKLNQKSPINQK